MAIGKALFSSGSKDYGTQKHLFDFGDGLDGTVVVSQPPHDEIIPLCEPFVKWAGGKTQHLKELYAAAPVELSNRYFEPFLGGGALFFYLISAKKKRFTAVYISDINSDLINSYVAIKDNVEKLIELLELHKIGYQRSPEEYYYNNLRNEYNNNYNNNKSAADTIERAAQFIAINKTCFNGLYRVNPNTGLFNVPIGSIKDPSTICNSSNLRNVGLALRHSNKATIRASDYKKILLEEGGNPTEGDFIYFDPPYNPESLTADFVGYTKGGFSIKDQKELAEIFRKLDDRKCKVMLTNSDTPLIRELYAPFAKYTVEVSSKRAINCKGAKRQGHTDLIIRNYS